MAEFGITGGGKKVSWKFYFSLALLAAVISVAVLVFYTKIQGFFKETPAEKAVVQEKKLWHETLPEPTKKQPYTITVVPPPKVVGTIQPKGGSK